MPTKTETENRSRGGDVRAEDMEKVDLKHLSEAALCSFRDYARSNPETVALWCVGIGFVLGWKLKPW
jgi:hypothetical protein